MLVTPIRSLRVVIPARQTAIHRNVRVRAHAERNSHTSSHQCFQSMSSLLAGRHNSHSLGVDNLSPVV